MLPTEFLKKRQKGEKRNNMPEEKEEVKEKQNEEENEEEVPKKFMSFRDFFLNSEHKWYERLVVKRKEHESIRKD